MKLNWLVFAVLVAGGSAASIHQSRAGARDIPVQVVYDAPDATISAARNHEEKPQLPVEDKPIGAKNLEAKPQLSAEEASKVKIVTPEQSVEAVQPGPVPPVDGAAYQQGEEQNIDDIYDKIQEIINNGAKKIQADFEKMPEDTHKQEVLLKVNNTLEEFLENTKKLIELRNVQTLKQDTTTASPFPNPIGIFQQIFNSFQSFSGSLFSGLNPAGQPGQTQSDGTTAAPGIPSLPNPVEVVQGIFSQVQNNLGQLFGAVRPPSTQSDETPAAQGPLQFIQQLTNIFNRPTTVPAAQSDEHPAPPSNPIVGFVQGAISNVQNALNPSTAAPAAHDEVVTQGNMITPPGNPLTAFQSAGQNILQAIQNNPFFPGSSSTAAPTSAAALANAATTAAPNPAAAAIANAQGQFQQVVPNNPFQQPAQQAIAAGTSQANQVVSQLAQQGVPVPGQVNQTIQTAQQVSGGSSTPAKPAAVEAPASDDIVEVEVPVDQGNEEAAPVVSEQEVEPSKVFEEPVPVLEEEPIKEELSNEVAEEKKEVQA